MIAMAITKYFKSWVLLAYTCVYKCWTCMQNCWFLQTQFHPFSTLLMLCKTVLIVHSQQVLHLSGFWLTLATWKLRLTVRRKGEDEVGFFFFFKLPCTFVKSFPRIYETRGHFFFSGAGDFSLDNFLWVPITNLFSCPFRSTFDNSSNCS